MYDLYLPTGVHPHHDTFPYQGMHESSSYRWVYRLSSVWPYKLWDTHLFDLKTSPMWYNHLLMRNLIFICMRAQEQVREQVSTSVQQRDELDTRINVIFYHLFDLDMWLFITYWGRMQYVLCTRMYGIMEDLRRSLFIESTMIPRW